MIMLGGRIKVDIVRDTTTLTVIDVMPEDSGRYTLVVENELGCDTCNASVTVEGNTPICVNQEEGGGKMHFSLLTLMH